MAQHHEEYHITVAGMAVQRFKEACDELRVKCLIFTPEMKARADAKLLELRLANEALYGKRPAPREVRGPDKRKRRRRGELPRPPAPRQVPTDDLHRIFKVISQQQIPWVFSLQDMLDLLPQSCSEGPWNEKRLASQFKLLSRNTHPEGFWERNYVLQHSEQMRSGARKGQRLWRISYRRKEGPSL